MDSLLSLFQSASDGACGIDADQNIVLWNPAAEVLLGYSAREVVGRRCFEVFSGSDDDGCLVCRRRCAAYEATQRKKTIPTRNLRVKARDGRRLWLSLSTIPMPPGRRSSAVLVHLFRDVSRNKMLEDAVQSLLGDAGDLQSRPAPDSAPHGPELTRRELEVLRLLASGTPTAAIAETLFISPSTVRNHIHNILMKLDVHSRLEAVTLGLRAGLI